jgi:hypothetical protein
MPSLIWIWLVVAFPSVILKMEAGPAVAALILQVIFLILYGLIQTAAALMPFIPVFPAWQAAWMFSLLVALIYGPDLYYRYVKR